MEGDLPQRNLVVVIDPDQGQGGLPDGSGTGRLVDDQIDQIRGESWAERAVRAARAARAWARALERAREALEALQERELLQRLLLPWLSLPQRLSLPQLSLPQLVRLFNRGPTSAAVNGGELMTGGIQLYDGGVGHGDGIGNGFGANDQEQSSASINGDSGFFNRVPASAAVNGRELMTGGMHLYDGRVGRGDGRGNGFGANDQEQSSASINGELSTTYVRDSDYFRHVRTENGEVHLHMNPFVNMDGRFYNLTQTPHLNNLRSSQLINKVMLAITGQFGVALMFAALNDRSSPFPPAFYFVAAANAVGFSTTLISMLLRARKPRASGVLAKVGAVAASSAIILAMGMALHMRHIWVFLFLCIIAAVAVLFGHT